MKRASLVTATYAFRGVANAETGYRARTSGARAPNWAATSARYSASVAMGGAACPVSSALAPTANGTLLCSPFPMTTSGESRRTKPSTAGPQSCPEEEATETTGGSARRTASNGRARRQAAGSAALGAARLLGQRVPEGDELGERPLRAAAALDEGPLEEAPAASGEATSVQTFTPPADSPKIVTRAGSPPNAAMFRFTQRSAASWSYVP